jgi:hypothetical protein
VVGHIIDAALESVIGVLHRASRFSKERARPVATESGIEDESLVVEDGSNIATPLEVPHRFSKLADVGVTALDASWDGVAWPEPDLDGLRCPLHRVHTTFHGVEACSKRARATCHGTTLGTGLGRAVGVGRCTGLISAADGALTGRVQDHLVHSLEVDALDDVDFAVSRPRIAYRPECRPHATGACRHMLDISDDQTLVEHVVRLDTNRLAANVGLAQRRFMIDAQIDTARRRDANEAVVLGRGLVDILNESMNTQSSSPRDRMDPCLVLTHGWDPSWCKN